MDSFITVTKYDMSSSKPNNNASAQMIVQNGTPNFTPLSPFKYKEYSNTDSKDKQCIISFKTLSKLKSLGHEKVRRQLTNRRKLFGN